MLRTALRSQLRPATAASSRSFVSTVLLTKSWESVPLNDLKKEAKKRGLSPSGNKTTLITRLQEDDQKRSLTRAPSVAPQVAEVAAKRYASTAPATEVPGIPVAEAPSPLPKTYPKQILDVRLPDLSKPIPEEPIQIPFLPDIWDSSRIKAESAPKSAEPEVSTPKVVAVAGSATHHGGGPTYSLSQIEGDESFASRTSAPGASSSSFWGDIAEVVKHHASLKLPRPQDAEAMFDVAEKTETSTTQHKSYSRTLDRDEINGVWALLGLFAGTWVAAGYFKAPSKFAEHGAEVAENVEENVSGAH